MLTAKLPFTIVTLVGFSIFLAGAILNNTQGLTLPDFIYHYLALWVVLGWWLPAFLAFWFLFKLGLKRAILLAVVSDLVLWILPFTLLSLEFFENPENTDYLVWLVKLSLSSLVILITIYIRNRLQVVKKALRDKRKESF